MLLTLALVCALSVCALAEYPVTLTDQAGREVTIENKPEHIVSGYYISTSACIALGLYDRMAAVEAKADFPSECRNCEKLQSGSLSGGRAGFGHPAQASVRGCQVHQRV